MLPKKLLYYLVSQVSFTSAIDTPVIDESILLLGNFDAISLFNENTYNLSSPPNDLNLYQLSSTNDSIQLLPTLNITNPPSIWHPLNDSNSLMIIDNKPYILSLTTSTVTELSNWNDINGEIESIYYDKLSDIIYFGGSLSFNNTYGIVQYDYSQNKIFSLPFGGFEENSIINTIFKYDQSDSIIFGGMFDNIGYSNLLNITYNETITNNTFYRNTSSLIDLSQKILISSSQVSATDGENYQNIICPQDDLSNAWILPNNEIGSWSAVLNDEINPSKIRLYNADSNNDGVKSFRVITYPANGIMNMSYIDPSDLSIKYCDAFCPLYLKENLSSALSNNNVTNNQYYTFTDNNQTVLQLTNTYQDFAFVDSIGVNSFTVQIMDYYGDYAALQGIELSSRGINVYANNTLNHLEKCVNTNQYDIDVNSNTLGDNINWQSSSFGNYLFADVDTNDITSDEGIEYTINIPVSGEYSILMYTSGCLQDNSCANRGIVNVTVYNGKDQLLANKLIYQTNDYEKYDVLYTGDLNLNKDNKPVSIQMTLLNQSQHSPIHFVADSIELQYIQLNVNEITGNITNRVTVEKHGEVKLNGIFEYNPSNFTDSSIEYPIGNTSINLIGSLLDQNAIINQIIYNDSSIIFAGDFESIYGSSLLGAEIETNHSTLLATDFYSIEGGTDGKEVSLLYGPTDEFVMIGSFNQFKNDTTNTIIDGSALYNSANNSIETLNISNTGAINEISGFYFNKTEYLVFNQNDSTSQLFDFTQDETFLNTSAFEMNILSSLDSNDKNWMLFNDNEDSYVIGSIKKYNTSSNNIVGIDNGVLKSFNSNNETFNTGAYINDNTFAVGGSNVFLINDDSINLLSENLNFDYGSSVESLLYYKNTLIFSVNGKSSYNSDQINGLAFYNMNHSSIKTLNETFSGSINALAVNPQYGNIITGGDFSVGDCNVLCTFNNDTDNLTINKTISDLSGSISALNYYNEYRVLVAGNFSSGDQHGYMGIYDTFNNSISMLDNFNSQLSGPVKTFIFGNETENSKSLNDTIVVMGNDYIGYFNDSRWNSLGDDLNLQNSSFSGISLVKSATDSFYNGQALLLTGDISTENYGIVSSAFWNGTQWIPYTLTSSQNMSSNNEKGKSIVRMTSMFLYQGSFTETATSSSSSSSSSSSTLSSTSTPDEDTRSLDFTNGQVAGVGLALAIGTLLLLTALGFLYSFLGGKGDESLDGLKLTGEDRLQDVVPPSNIINTGSV